MSIILGGIEIRKRTKLTGLQVYLASLRLNNPDIRVVIFNRSPENQELTSLLSKYKVEIIDAKKFDIKHNIPAVEIEIARFLQYYAWLQTNIIESAILTDILDIVWQHDPTRIIPKYYLKVFQENNKIGDCPFNSKWMREVWPNNPLLDKQIICCGVIAGEEKAIYSYLKFYDEEFTRRGISNIRRGFDSAVLNGYANAIHDISILPFINSDCMHLGYANPDKVNRTYVISYESIIPKVVHQYNRHPSIMAELYTQWI
jgi:hypothetical protein